MGWIWQRYWSVIVLVLLLPLVWAPYFYEHGHVPREPTLELEPWVPLAVRADAEHLYGTYLGNRPVWLVIRRNQPEGSIWPPESCKLVLGGQDSMAVELLGDHCRRIAKERFK